MQDKVTKTLNRLCTEAGICDSGTVLIAPGIRHAAELWREGSPHKIVMCCWHDGAVTSCAIEIKSGGKQCCYTAEGGGEELYYAFQAHLTSPEVGYKVKSVEVEKSNPSIVATVAALTTLEKLKEKPKWVS